MSGWMVNDGSSTGPRSSATSMRWEISCSTCSTLFSSLSSSRTSGNCRRCARITYGSTPSTAACRADAQLAELPGGGPARRRERPLGVGERKLCLVEQRSARIGELDRAPRPVDELGAQLTLQLLNLLTQRWLRDVQPLRSAPEMAFLGHRHEVAKQSQLRISHICSI